MIHGEGDMTSTPPIRFVHLTDPHIAVGEETIQFGVDTTRTFRRVLRAIAASEPPPDFVLITGDLVNDGLPESYESLRDLLKTLPCPIHLSLGNHDRRAAFRWVVLGESVPGEDPYCYVFHVQGTDFIVLDSYLEGTSAGILDRRQLDWLVEQLRISRGTPVVCVHHHFIPTGLAWLDRLILRNGEELAGILRVHPAVPLVLFGHIHRVFEGALGASALLGTPTTCYQFGPRSESREISTEPPAYRVVTLEDGRARSEVRWLEGPDGPERRLGQYYSVWPSPR